MPELGEHALANALQKTELIPLQLAQARRLVKVSRGIAVEQSQAAPRRRQPEPARIQRRAQRRGVTRKAVAELGGGVACGGDLVEHARVVDGCAELSTQVLVVP